MYLSPLQTPDQEPEEYNVLHIGSESNSPLDRVLMNQVRRAKLAKISMLVLGGLMLLGLIFMNGTLQSNLSESEEDLNALIDEVGALSQKNFELSERLESQEAVLGSIEKDFTALYDALKKSGESSSLESIFSSILGRFSSDDSSPLSKQVVLSSETEDDTLDILLLGTNGAHTDTILIASVNVEKGKVSLFSVPRDLYINGRRINEYFTYYGVDQLKRMLTSVTGLTIDKYVQVDLEGFVEVVEAVKGLDIYVDKAIYDSTYPNGKGGYKTYSIDVGYHHLNGSEALMYARSRHGSSDFDRAARQQKVISALRTKILQLDAIMDMKTLTELFQTGLTYTKTDLNVVDLLAYYYDFQDFDLQLGFVLSTSNYLYSMINESGAYILLPKTGNFTQIQEAVSNLVN